MLRLVGEWRVTVVTPGQESATQRVEPAEPDALDDGLPREATLTFDGDGQVYGTGGVNRLRGTWAVSGDALTFGPVVTTLMAGPAAAMRQEAAVLRLLGEPLSLRTPDGRAQTARDPVDGATEGDAQAALEPSGRLELVAPDGAALHLERVAPADVA